MDFTSQMGIFLFGFFIGAGVISIIAWYINFRKLYQVKNPADELSALHKEMESINSSLEDFKLYQAKRDGAYENSMQNFILAGERIKSEAERLGNTLIKGGSQKQGTWGEFVLKNILDTIGFREGEEYETQKSFVSDDGKSQRPDVIVHMPGKRDIIIDSKVSLVAWDEYTNATDEDNKAIALKRHIDLVKTHIKNLNKDSYSKLYDINTIDSILMFMPVEPAYQVIGKEGKSIIEEALDKKITIVGPSTLYLCLRVVEHMWAIDFQSKRSKDIATQAGKIYDQAVNVYDSFNEVSKSFTKATDKIEEAKKRLQDSPSSLTNKLEKLKKMGRITTKKNLPDNIIDDNEN